MRPRKRDPSFLYIAAIAGTGGVIAIVGSIGFPLWARFHGHPWNPAFSLFAGWGVAALGGAYACIRTYFISDDPHRPPRGGVHLEVVKNVDALPAPTTESDAATQRRAA